jgi:hypothetical protein
MLGFNRQRQRPPDRRYAQGLFSARCFGIGLRLLDWPEQRVPQRSPRIDNERSPLYFSGLVRQQATPYGSDLVGADFRSPAWVDQRDWPTRRNSECFGEAPS